ncbi:uncharacterized protein [Amphiura filiformis]|uniref:uncharacterized protein n=1 Tax=Amphiura filiformis TaxID=82378 RepID=UPI003B20D828
MGQVKSSKRSVPGQQPLTFGKVKPELDKALQYLKTCDDYTTTKARKALETIGNALEEVDDIGEKPVTSYLVKQGFGELFPRMWSGLCAFLENEKWGQQGYKSLEEMLGTYCTFTDPCHELAAELGKCGSIPLLLAGLGKLEIYFEDEDKFEPIEDVVAYIIGILFISISQCSSNRKIFRDAKAFDILKEYLKLQNKTVSGFSLMILAYVVDESESSVLATGDGIVARLWST